MMEKQIPDTSNTAVLEAWFASVGLAVEVVDRCSLAACEHCAEALDEAA